MPPPDRITVTRTGSTIGEHKRKYKEACLRGLGLGRIGTSRTLENNPVVWGLIGKVGHLVAVQDYLPVETRSRRGRPRPARGRHTYIWEQDLWPEFTWDEDRLAPLIDEITRARRALRDRFNAQDLDPNEQQEIAAQSSKLFDAPKEHPGVPEVMREATENYTAPLTTERLREWHRQLFPDGVGDGRKIVTGDWRRAEDDPMVVEYSKAIGKEHVLFEAPPAERINGEIDRLLRWIADTQGTHPILAAGIAHLWLLTIHPFDNGNGRTARALTETMLTRAEDNAFRLYSVASQIQAIRAERKDYDLTIEAAQKADCDITQWLEWFLNCELRAISCAEARLTDNLARCSFWQRFPEESMNSRQLKMINKLFDGFEGNLTAGKWGKMTKSSESTAQRDIDDLLKRGALKEVPDNPGQIRYLLGKAN